MQIDVRELKKKQMKAMTEWEGRKQKEGGAAAAERGDDHVTTDRRREERERKERGCKIDKEDRKQGAVQWDDSIGRNRSVY